MNSCRVIVVLVIAAVSSIGYAAVGDVSFRIPDRAWHSDQDGLSLSLDVFVDIDFQPTIPAIGWGMVVTITPQPGSTGTVEFAPPSIVGNSPNLSPASTNAYLDFDIDQNGKSYGEMIAETGELNAFAAYVQPTVGTPPSLDGNGNLTLPAQSGLVALPVILSADASGIFVVDFDPNPAVTGVVYATGLAEPDDIALHPIAQHVAGLLSIVGLPGDYNIDGTVDAADYTVWRDSLGGTGTNLLADGNSNGVVDAADYAIWRNNFGAVFGSGSVRRTSVPESSTLVIVAAALAAACCTRLRKSLVE